MKRTLRKLWHFIWEDNSILSWVVNVVLAFIIIKFLVYPGLGFLLATTNPVVAVVSGSMEHNGNGFEEWWNSKASFYEKINITKTDFEMFKFKNGFNKGDLMILKGKDLGSLAIGDIIVFKGNEKDPVIHRLISKQKTGNTYVLATKGDNNNEQLSYEKKISEEQIIGRAVIRVPLLGYVKIVFTDALKLLQPGAA